MNKNIKKLTDEQLANKRDQLFRRITKFEHQAHEINNTNMPCGAYLDNDAVQVFNELVSDTIVVLLEIINRPEWLFKK